MLCLCSKVAQGSWIRVWDTGKLHEFLHLSFIQEWGIFHMRSKHKETHKAASQHQQKDSLHLQNEC